MSDISKDLENIENARYGKDARQSIHDGIEQCHNDVNNPNLTTEALQRAVQKKIDDNTIQNIGLENGSVTQAKLSPAFSAQLAAMENQYSQISMVPKDGSVTTEKLADKAVTNDKIADGTITSDKFSSKLQDELLTGGDASINLYILAKQILPVLQKAVYTTKNTQAYDSLAQSVESFKPEGLVQATYALENCKLDNTKPYFVKGRDYKGNVTVVENTDFQSITVQMGGKDITSTAVNDKAITISPITDNFTISAISKSRYYKDGIAVRNYCWSVNTGDEHAGDAYIDTGIALHDLKPGSKFEIGVDLSQIADDVDRIEVIGVDNDSAFGGGELNFTILVSKNKITCGEITRTPLGESNYGASYGGKYYMYINNTEKYKTPTESLWVDEAMTEKPTGTFFTQSQTAENHNFLVPKDPTKQDLSLLNMWIFRVNIGDMAYRRDEKKAYRVPNFKVSCFKIWDPDGNLITNMRAALRESDNAPGMYDLVRDEFFTNACDTGALAVE